MSGGMSFSRDQFGTRIFFYIILTFFPYVFLLYPGIFDTFMKDLSWWNQAFNFINGLVEVFLLEWFWRQNRKPERERNHRVNTPKPTIRLLGYLFIAVNVAYELHTRIDFFMALTATIVLTTEMVIILREKLNRQGFLSRLLIVVLISFNLVIYMAISTSEATNLPMSTQFIFISSLVIFIAVLATSELVQRYWIMAARRFGDQLS